MGNLQIKRRPSKSPQIGDLRERITLNERTIRPPVAGSAKMTHTYVVIGTVWASLETVDGDKDFGGVDPEDVWTHRFRIRYRSDVNSEIRIGYDGVYYEIKRVNNSDGRKRFLEIKTVRLGVTTKDANK